MSAQNADPVRDFGPVYGIFLGDLGAIADTLELLRQRMCLYGPNAQRCDCKMRAETQPLGQSEASGCYELRAAITLLRAAQTGDMVAMERQLNRFRRALDNVQRAVEYAAHTDGGGDGAE